VKATTQLQTQQKPPKFIINNNETSQFLTDSFAADKLIDTPGKSFALILNAITTSQFDTACAYFAPNTNNNNFYRNEFR
jgi:hypothetical protein